MGTPTRTSFLATVALAASLCVAACVSAPATVLPATPSAHPSAPAFIGHPAQAAPLPADGLAPENPRLAPSGRNSMHGDSANTGAVPLPGPLGRAPQVAASARGLLGGECATIAFDSRGRVLTTCMGFERPALLLLDPRTLRELARYDLPPRHRGPQVDNRLAAADTSGGLYFFVDDRGRATVPDVAGLVKTFRVDEDRSGPRLVLESAVDLTRVLTREGRPPHRIVSAMPDWKGRTWFATRHGRVGLVPLPVPEQRTTRPRVLDLDDERVSNALAVASDGVYLASDHALYRFTVDDRTGGPALVWREPYDRGPHRKPGQVSRGSGTTPTLIGDELIAIVDNAGERAQVLVYKRLRQVEGPRLVCAMPVFEAGRSAVERSLVAFGSSLVVANSFGQDPLLSMRQGIVGAPGVARIDIRPDLSGCDVVWESKQTLHPTAAKLSQTTGLMYAYSKVAGQGGGPDAWYLSALDFRTGAPVFSVLVGTGVDYDSRWSAIALGPDGAAWLGVTSGLVRITDTP